MVRELRNRDTSAEKCWAMTSGSFRQNALLGFVPPKRFLPPSSVVVPSCIAEPSSIVPGEGAPGRFGECPPSPRGAKRRQALVRNAAPGGLALRQSPSLQRKGTAGHMTRAGAPIGASPRRFSFVPGTAFWKRTGAPIHERP